MSTTIAEEAPSRASHAPMSFSIRVDPSTGQPYMAVSQKGRALLLNPHTNKGTAFTRREREELDLGGLVPPAVCDIHHQLKRTYENFKAKTTNLDKFVFLTSLQDRNETLFYRLVLEHIDEMMPIVYTPVVGEACQKYSHIYRRGRGLYIAYEDKDRIEHILRNAGIAHPSVIVVTDGERILGLGDQGAGGMGIPIGKLCLYTLCAGVSPYSTLPITLDVGTNNEERLNDPLYLGMRHPRVRGEEYQAFIDAFVAAVQKVFPHVVLQWEDFLKENALFQLARFRDQLCTFNDDVQGTAGVVLAGVYGALRITGQRMRDQRVVFAGAGASAQGIAELLVSAMMEDGLTHEEAVRRIWTTDSHGLVSHARAKLEGYKATYARSKQEVAGYACKDRGQITLLETVLNAKPTMLIGVSATPGVFDEPVIRAMSRSCERPIVLPLSNPTSKAEVTPEDALRWSEGRAIVATGSPFDPVMVDGKRHRIGQCNNSFVFPGVGLGLTVSGARRVSNGMFLEAAKALAATVKSEDLAECAVYPELARIRECSFAVACATVRRAVAEGHADPEILEHLERTVERAMWYPEYLQVRFELKEGDMPRIGVAVVGAGFMGGVHAEALRRAGCEVVGVLGVSAAETTRFADALGGVKAYPSLAELLADPRVESVHIGTPNRLHFEMAKAALEAGKHVVCEKPLAMTSRETAALVALARQHPRQAAAVNYNIRFYPLSLEARERVRGGALGKLHHVSGSYVQDWLLLDTDYNWRVLAAEGGELRAVADIGTHWLDLVHAITGLEVESLCADLLTVHPLRRRPKGEVETFSGKLGKEADLEPVAITTEDYGSILLRFKGGARGTLVVSQVTAGRKNCLRYELAGEKGALAWNSENPEQLWIGRRGGPNELLMRDPSILSGPARAAVGVPGGHAEGYADTFKQHFRAFYGHVAKGDFAAPPPFATFLDGHREVVLCEAVLESHRKGGWVKVPELAPEPSSTRELATQAR